MLSARSRTGQGWFLICLGTLAGCARTQELLIRQPEPAVSSALAPFTSRPRPQTDSSLVPAAGSDGRADSERGPTLANAETAWPADDIPVLPGSLRAQTVESEVKAPQAASTAPRTVAAEDPVRDGAVRPSSPGFSDEPRLGQWIDPFQPRFVRPPRTRSPGEENEQEDTDLSRPRAEREGEGGGPTRVAEEEDEEEFPKPHLLEKALGMEESDINVFGWIDGSFTANPSRPSDGENFGVFPNNHSNSWMFNQVYFVVEKPLDPEEDDEFGYGFRIDNMPGTDWQISHAVGLFDGAFVPNHFGYDFPQLYGEIHLPVLSEGGIDVKGGRFYSLAGYEDLPAPSRPLLSTTYMFSFAQPITHLGVMSIWHVTDQLNVYNGVVNGWDRWINIHNKWGYAGAIAWDSADGRTNLTGTLNWGPNQFQRFLPANFQEVPVGVTQPPFLAGRRNLAARGSNAFLFTGVVTHDWTDALHLVGETNIGFENNVPGAGFDGTTQNASWYGLAGWVLYDLVETDRLTAVARAEVFRDNNGILTGFADNFAETTLGLIYRPRNWLWTRPEIRYDWAQFTRPYNGGDSKNQLTFGFDVILLF